MLPRSPWNSVPGLIRAARVSLGNAATARLTKILAVTGYVTGINPDAESNPPIG
jgi:hypothetical protein